MSERLREAAEAAVEQELNNFVALRRIKAMPDDLLKSHQFLVEDCVDCGEELPLFRKQRGRTRCVPCQEVWERKTI